MDLFNIPAFRGIFIEIQDHMAHMKIFAARCLTEIDNCEGAMSRLGERDSNALLGHDWASDMDTSLSRVRKLMRFLAYMCRNDETSATLDLNPQQDVMWLVSYSGKNAMEKGFSEILHQQPWLQICDEAVRTATTSVGLRPQRDRAVASLDGLDNGSLWGLSTHRLEELVNLVPQLISGMRKAEVDPFCLKFRNAMITSFEDMETGRRTPAEVGTKFVSLLVAGLNHLKHIAGTDTLAASLREWMTKHSIEMSWNEFEELATDSQASGVCSMPSLQEVMLKLQKQDMPQQFLKSAKSLIVTGLRGFVAEVGNWRG